MSKTGPSRTELKDSLIREARANPGVAEMMELYNASEEGRRLQRMVDSIQPLPRTWVATDTASAPPFPEAPVAELGADTE